MGSAVSAQKNPPAYLFSNKPPHLKVSFILKLMLFTVPALAQKNSKISLKWEITNELPADSGHSVSLGFAGPVTGIHNDMLFIAGGANFPEAMPWEGGVKKFHASVYTYHQEHHQLKLISKSGKLPHAIAYAASCTTAEGVIYAGGENEKGASNEVWLMNWDNRAKDIHFMALPPLPEPVSNAAATLIGTTVYLAGGENSTSTSAQFLALDLGNLPAGWKKLADIPHPVSHTVLTAVTGKTGNKIYLCGGRKKNSNGISDVYNSVFVYNVITNSWEEIKSLPYALSAGTGLLHDGNSILLFGGDKGTVFHQTERLIVAINAEKDSVKKKKLNQEKIKLQSEHPGFSREVLLYNIKMDTWTVAGTIPFETPVTTTAVKIKHGVCIPSGEIRAGVRSPKMLILKIRSRN